MPLNNISCMLYFEKFNFNFYVIFVVCLFSWFVSYHSHVTIFFFLSFSAWFIMSLIFIYCWCKKFLHCRVITIIHICEFRSILDKIEMFLMIRRVWFIDSVKFLYTDGVYKLNSYKILRRSILVLQCGHLYILLCLIVSLQLVSLWI